MKRGAVVVVAVLAAGCATPRVDDPPLAVQIVVTGLREDERAELRDRVCAIDGVTKCALEEDAPPAEPPAREPKKRRRASTQKVPSPEAKITFGYRGSLGNLRWRIKELPHPGLEPVQAEVLLGYRGFDNKAPSIALVEPAEDKAVITEHTAHIAVKVPDVDTAAVKIGDDDGLRAGELFSATVEGLAEGENPIVVAATDQAGNTGKKTVTVVVDTTAPALQVEVDILAYDKAVVKGKVASDAVKVTVDGKEVSRDFFGGFEEEVAVDPDKTMVEVVAVDAHGNAKTIKRSVKIASPMSDATAK